MNVDVKNSMFNRHLEVLLRILGSGSVPLSQPCSSLLSYKEIRYKMQTQFTVTEVVLYVVNKHFCNGFYSMMVITSLAR